MAHNIEINNGVASYVENGKKERAWHGLGQVFDRPLFVKEALELAHADYMVELQPLVMLTPKMMDILGNGGQIDADMILDAIVNDRKATMRTDKNAYLGVVSNSYGIVQNTDAFSFIDTLVTGQLADRNHTPVIETAGVLGKGERIFVTAKFPEDIILDNKGDDQVEMNMVFTTSHDGSGAVKCIVTPTRVVCNNTLNYAMGHNAGVLSLRHSSNVMSRLDLNSEENRSFAYKALNLYKVYKKSLTQSFEHLKNIKVSEKDLNNILAQVLLSPDDAMKYQITGKLEDDMATRGKNIFNEVRETIETGVGQEFGERGTGLWLINGLTSYYQNEAKYRNNEMKFDSIQNGTVKMKIQKAYNLVTAAV